MPSGVTTWSELISKTSMVGRYNYTKYMLEKVPGIDKDFYNTKLNEYDAISDSFETSSTIPYWDYLYIPDVRPISNETTIIVIMDNEIASVGEGFIFYLKQMENVLFVGENTYSAVTFGQISYHQLPNSRVDLVIPISLNIFVDMVFREEVGLIPDIWVPSQDALNYSVAAIRNGLINTPMEIPDDYFDMKFVPEDYSKKEYGLSTLLMITATSICLLSIIINILRKKKK